VNGAAYYSHGSAIIDLQIYNQNGETRGMGGDVNAEKPDPKIDFGKGSSLRLLNWREVTTVE
jgi:type IV pilus assembly protein PilY1